MVSTLSKFPAVLVFVLLMCVSFSFLGSTSSVPDSVEAGGTRGETIVVNASGGGDYTRIQWAVDNASDGDTVLVHPGKYVENVVVNKSIEIVGSGMENTIIDGGGENDVIYISSNQVKVSELSIINSGQWDWGYDCGIEIDKVDDVMINSVNCSENRFGIYLFQSNEIIINNSISSNNLYGILVDESNHITISNNTIYGNELEGIHISDSNNNTISYNSVFDNRNGIDLEESLDHVIMGNTVENNQYRGITIYLRSNDNTIENNVVRNNHDNGIWFYYSSNHNLVKNNHIESNDYSGINIVNSCHNDFVSNNLVDDGISIVGSYPKHWNTHSIETSNTVDGRPIYYYVDQDNKILPQNAGQVLLANCSNIVVENQDLNAGFSIGFSDNITLSNNTISNEESSFVLSEDNSMSDNHFQNGSSLSLWESYRDFITDNEFSKASILLSSCINITVTNNNLTNGGIGFSEGSQGGQQGQQGQQGAYGDILYVDEELWSHDIEGNMINGRPLYFFSFKNNFTVPQDGYRLIITKCSDFLVENLTETSYAHISYSKNGVIRDCKFGEGYGGIRIDRSRTITINNNTFFRSYENIYILENTDLIVTNNSIVSSPNTGIKMIFNDNCVVKHNDITNCGGNGIHIYANEGIVLTDNHCINNSNNGIYLSDCNQVGVFGPIFMKNNNCSENNVGIEVIYHWVDIKNLYIEENVCNSNTLDGIILTNYGTTLNKNICNNNGKDGISIVPWYPDGMNIITNNSCNSNYNYGINISKYCDNNLIHHNNLIGNNEGGVQAFDNGSANQWNLSGEGNYWAEYPSRYPNATNDGTVWSQPYEIEGSESPKDHFPLVEPVDIYHIPPMANAGPNITAYQHRMVNFTARGSYGFPAIINYTWTFNYNSSPINLYGPNPSFTFHEMGTYPVTLTVTNENEETDTDRMIVTVLDGVAPTAIAGEDVTIETGETVHFDGSASSDNDGIVNYTWNFTYDDKNMFLFGKTADYTFGIPGQYEVILNVRDAMGNRATDEINVTVRDTTPPLAVAGDNITINAGERAFFNGSMSNDNVAVVNYTWEFTYDHTEHALYGMYQSFTFAIPGKYNVNLTVRDSDGNLGNDNLTVTVVGEYIPDPSDNNESAPDSDGDGWNDTFENASGSDPYDPASTPFDFDGDGWDNSYEEEVGSDPFNSTSIPSDRDGDGHPNDEDAYPDDLGRWEWEPEDDLPPDDGETDGGGKGDDRMRARYVWAGIGVLCMVISGVIFWAYIKKKRKGKPDEDGEGEAEPDGDGEEDEERLGRVKREDEDE